MVTLKQRFGRALVNRLPISRFLFDLLRDETAAARTRMSNRILPWRRSRLADIRHTPSQLVNVACGPHVVAGFLNLDTNATVAGVVPWDCRRSLPLADGMAAGIRVEHFVEHIEPREDLPAFLADAQRALRPGGVLRIIVPDAGRYLDAYCRSDLSGFRELSVPDPFPDDLPTRMDVINHVFHQWHEHRWGYDLETLEHRLLQAGFSRVMRMSFRHSLDPLLACDRDEHAPYSLFVDAVKESKQARRSTEKLQDENTRLKEATLQVQTTVSNAIESNSPLVAKALSSTGARTAPLRARSDFGVGLQTLGVSDSERIALNEKIHAGGLGVDPSRKDVTLYVHYVKN